MNEDETYKLRRSLEEIMLKLLLHQTNENDIEIILRQSKAPNLYFIKHIQPHCKNHFSELLKIVNDGDLQTELFLTFKSDTSTISAIELKTQIKSFKKHEAYEKIPAFYLLPYLKNIESSVNDRTNIDEVKGLRLVMDLLLKCNQMIEIHLIRFINFLFIKIKTEEKDYLSRMIIEEIYQIKNSARLTLLLQENERNGTPGITLINEKNTMLYDIEIMHSSNCLTSSFVSKLSSDTTLYELLILIIINLGINIDLYSIEYTTNDNQSKHLEYNYLNYLQKLSQVFSIERGGIQDKDKISIVLNLHGVHYNEDAYFEKDRIREAIKDQLKGLDFHNNLLMVNRLFSYITDFNFQQTKERIFNQMQYVQHESLIALLQNNKKDSIFLLHLLIGFSNKDISKPYLRNIYPEHNLRVYIEKHFFNCFEQEKILLHLDDTKNKMNHIFTQDYSVKYLSCSAMIERYKFETQKNTNLLNQFSDKCDDMVNETKGDLFAKKINDVITFVNSEVNKENLVKLWPILITKIKACNLSQIIALGLSSSFILLFNLITSSEQKSSHYSQLYLINMINRAFCFKQTQENTSPKDYILFYSEMIEYFLKNPRKWAPKFNEEQFNLSLLNLFEIQIINQENYAMKAGIVFCLFKFLVQNKVLLETTYQTFVRRVIEQDFQEHKVKYKELRNYFFSLIQSNSYNYYNSDSLIDDRQEEEFWILTVILLQLFHSNQYIKYTENKDLMLPTDTTLLSLMKNFDRKCSYSNYKLLCTKNNSTHTNSIRELLNKIKPIKSQSSLYSFNPQPDKSSSFKLLVTESPHVANKYQLIGCIIVSGEKLNDIQSYCINKDYQTDQIKLYHLSKDKTAILEKKKKIFFYDLIKQRFSDIDDKKGKANEFFFFYVNTEMIICHFDNIISIVKQNSYPSFLLYLLAYSTNLSDSQLRDLINASIETLENNEYNIGMIHQIKNKYKSIKHEWFDKLLKT